MTKSERQQIGVNIFKLNKGVGTLEYVPRFGKTRIGLMILELTREKHRGDKIVILVPSEYIKKNWEANIEEFFSHHFMDKQAAILDTIILLTANEALNYNFDKTISLLIIDEIHKFVTDRRIELIKSIKYKFILGLTGTYPSKFEDKKKLDAICPVIDKIGEEEALLHNWISEYVEYNIPLELTEEEKEEYEQYSVLIRDTLDLFRNAHKLLMYNENRYLFEDDYKLITSCYSGYSIKIDGKSHYMRASLIRQEIARLKGWKPDLNLSIKVNAMLDEYWNPVAIEERVKKFIVYVRNRNEILNKSLVKLDAVLKIFEVSRVPTICFNESTEMADMIEENINTTIENCAVCYHSNIKSRPLMDTNGDFVRYQSGNKAGQVKMFGKTTLKNNAIEGIRSGRFKFLSTVKAVDEGLDIPELQQVISTAGTTNNSTYIQRTSRGKTIDVNNSNKVTTIINLYFDDFFIGENKVASRDKQKLLLRQKGSMNITTIDLTNFLELF